MPEGSPGHTPVEGDNHPTRPHVSLTERLNLEVDEELHFRFNDSRPCDLLGGFVLLFLACLPVLAQVKQPSDAPPPAANPGTIFERAVEMYEAKKYSTALLAFQEASAAGVKEAAAYLGVMYSEGQGTSRRNTTKR